MKTGCPRQSSDFPLRIEDAHIGCRVAGCFCPSRTCVRNLIQRGIRKWHGRLAHGFTSALVPRDGNPTRKRGSDCNPRSRVGLPLNQQARYASGWDIAICRTLKPGCRCLFEIIMTIACKELPLCSCFKQNAHFLGASNDGDSPNPTLIASTPARPCGLDRLVGVLRHL